MIYSYIREELTDYKTNNYILSIQLSLDGLSFYIRDKDAPEIPLFFLYKKFDVPGFQSLIQEFKDFHELDNKTFFKIVIIYHTSEFCIIPDEFYDGETAKEYLNLSHPLPDNIKPEISDVQEIQAKVVFHVNDELTQIIESKYKEAVVLHSSCPSLNYGTGKTDKFCMICYYGSTMSVAVFEDKKLKFFNIFSIYGANDIIYYTLSALRNCKMKTSEVTLHISGVENESQEAFLTLSKYFSNPVAYIPQLNITDFPANLLFNHLEGLHCVS